MRFNAHIVCFLSASIGLSVLVMGDTKAVAQTKDETKIEKENYGTIFDVQNPVLARQNWVLNCQGCHKVGALGLGLEMPDLNGEISKFLTVEGGREFIGQVNGIANSPLSNADLADLVNWMLVTYDPVHIPEDAQAYTAEEVARFRKTPLTHDANTQRAALNDAIKQK